MRGSLLSSIVFFTISYARLLHSLPEDTYAFPKYNVAFLTNLPLLNQTAQRWLIDGLSGGELEFMDYLWKEDSSTPTPPKEIGGVDHIHTFQPVPLRRTFDNYSLELMRIAPQDSYLCYIPNPLDLPPPPSEEEDADVTPVHSWSLLQPLSGSCLYHRQGWFTYSYCHNNEIRQFKELIQAHPNPAGGYKPEEDEDWESYTLGRAPTTPEPGADLTIAQQNAIAANLELARGAGSRYLVQRWGDGTICDRTGKSREVEVQFHCSMAMSDTILFVKEAKTCSYVLVINTPRLCGEPGFRSRRDVSDQAHIRCREIVEGLPAQQPLGERLPEVDYPLKTPRSKPVLPPAKERAFKPLDPASKGFADIVRRLNALLGNNQLKLAEGQQLFIQELADDGNLVIELVDEDTDGNADGTPELQRAAVENTGRITDVLRAAGYDIQSEQMKAKKKEQKRDGKAEEDQKRKRQGGGIYHDDLHHRDEL